LNTPGAAKAYSDAELRNAILGELRSNTVLTLATTDETGPHAASLMYAHDEFDIYWLSDPGTRHSMQLEASGTAAVTIAAQQDDFTKIRGLQIEGIGSRLTDAATSAAAFELLVERYPFLRRFGLGKLARHLGAAEVYLFDPSRITLIDNSKGFGFKQTLDLADSSGRVMSQS
jgi:uncharacterized protein YhbP (UPF0306 family)